MNLALAAFILTLLFLPAITFRLSINRQENLRELLSTFSLTDSIWVFSIVPILIHIVLVSLLYITHHIIKFDLILNILYSNKDFRIVNKTFTLDILEFLSYCLFAVFLGYMSGQIFNFFEGRNKLFSRLLGLGNEWYELFEGYSAGKRMQFDFVYIDVLSSTKEATILYSGILINYYFKPKSTELEFLVLQSVTRRDLRKEQFTDVTNIFSGKASYYSAETSKSLKIPGEYFIVPVSEILNINVSYLLINNKESDIESLENK